MANWYLYQTAYDWFTNNPTYAGTNTIDFKTAPHVIGSRIITDFNRIYARGNEVPTKSGTRIEVKYDNLAYGTVTAISLFYNQTNVATAFGSTVIYTESAPTFDGMNAVGESFISGKYRLPSQFNEKFYNAFAVPLNFEFNGNHFSMFGFAKRRMKYYETTTSHIDQINPDIRIKSSTYYLYFGTNDNVLNGDYCTEICSGTYKVNDVYVGNIIDFGDTPQSIPTPLKDWIDNNFEVIYPYSYTVKSPDGTVLATGEELPPIRSVTLSTVGNNVTMVMTGSNSRQYTLTWSHTVPEGKIFLGLGYAATEKRASIPAGTTTAVTWDSDITVYEIYGKYVPPATPFTITLYQNTGENNRVDKTNYLTSVGSINGALRAECSIFRPSIIIAQDTLPTFNYVYIAVFGRYYFVTGITAVNFGLWRIELNTDVLMTYKEGVKALTAIIARQENDYNDDLIDTEVPTEKEPTITYQEIPNTVLTTQEDNGKHSFVLTVVGA